MAKLGARDIRQVLAVAEYGSIRRAADALGLTQPGLSKNIRLIEERLGVPLFGRSTAGARLTPAGLQLLERGRQVLMDLESLEHDLVQLGRGDEGSVAIGLGALVAMLIGPQIAAEVERRYPAISLSIEVMQAPLFIPMVDAGTLDFSCGHIEDATMPQGIEARKIYRHKLVYFARSGHPLADRNDVKLADFCGYQFAGTTLYKRFTSWFLERTGSKIDDFMFICPDHELLADVVERTDYISACAPLVLSRLKERRALTEIHVSDGEFEHCVHCVVPRSRPLSLAARHVLEVVEMLLDGPARDMEATFCAPGFIRPHAEGSGELYSSNQ